MNEQTQQALRKTYGSGIHAFCFICLGAMGLIAVGVLGILLYESVLLFRDLSPWQFVFGTSWDPTINPTGALMDFGVLPLLCGTLLMTAIALIVVGPLGIYAAIYVAEYMTPPTRRLIKMILEVLIGIPTVVYGVFAALTLAPLFRSWGAELGLDIALESPLVTGFVMGIMAFPFVVSMCDDIFRAVPGPVRSSSLALGATHARMIRSVVLPASKPGMIAVFVLTVTRALGETMLVVMASGLTASMTLNPFSPSTTLTAQMSSLLTGDQSTQSPKTRAAFALGLLLFLMTWALNYLAFRIVRKYRIRYEG